MSEALVGPRRTHFQRGPAVESECCGAEVMASVGVDCAASCLRPVRRPTTGSDTERVPASGADRGPGQSAAGAFFCYENETMTSRSPRPTTTSLVAMALVGRAGLTFTRSRRVDDERGKRSRSCAEACGDLEMQRANRASARDERRGAGASETIVGRSHKPLPALRVVLPERTGGVLPPPRTRVPRHRSRCRCSRRIRRDSLEERRREDRAARVVDGWERRERDAKVALEPGAIDRVFAPDPRAHDRARRRRLDVDAEIRDETTRCSRATARTTRTRGSRPAWGRRRIDRDLRGAPRE